MQSPQQSSEVAPAMSPFDRWGTKTGRFRNLPNSSWLSSSWVGAQARVCLTPRNLVLTLEIKGSWSCRGKGDSREWNVPEWKWKSGPSTCRLWSQVAWGPVSPRGTLKHGKVWKPKLYIAASACLPCPIRDTHRPWFHPWFCHLHTVSPLKIFNHSGNEKWLCLLFMDGK